MLDGLKSWMLLGKVGNSILLPGIANIKVKDRDLNPDVPHPKRKPRELGHRRRPCCLCPTIYHTIVCGHVINMNIIIMITHAKFSGMMVLIARSGKVHIITAYDINIIN